MKTSEILSDLNMTLGTARKSSVQLAYRLSDAGGVIQGGDMRRLTNDPRKHTTTFLRSALLDLGCQKFE